MKLNSLLLLLFLQTSLFGQSLLTKVQRYGYSGDFGEWMLIYEEKNDYENEVLQHTQKRTFDVNADSLLLVNYQEATYDKTGNLVFEYDSINRPTGGFYRARTSYFYEDNRLKKIIKTDRGLDAPAYNLISTVNYEYNAAGQLLSEYKEFAPPYNIAGYLQKVKYDENGCIAELEDRMILGHTLKKSVYYRDEDCNIVAEARYEKDSEGIHYLRRDSAVTYHFPEGANIVALDSVYFPHQTNPAFREYANHWRRTETNLKGNIAKTVGGWVGSNYSTEEYSYDDYDNVIRLEKRTESLVHNWYIIDRFMDYTYEYEFNPYDYSNRHFIVKKRVEGEGTNDVPLVPREWEFDYYCSGEVRTELYKDISNASFPTTLTHYNYLNKTICEEEDLENDLKIYPNPSAGIFKIESALLESEVAQIKIFDPIGQLVFEQKSPDQSYFLELDVSYLNIGQYFLVIESGSTTVTQKIMIWR